GIVLVVVVVTVSFAAACTGGGSAETPDGANDPSSGAQAQSTQWAPVAVPAGWDPLTLTPLGHDVVVGAHNDTARLKPGLFLLDPGGSWTPIPLDPSSFYSHQARWRSVIVDGREIYAFGDAPGGAHFNPRWTTWQGTVDGVTEYPQFFETFGGW